MKLLFCFSYQLPNIMLFLFLRTKKYNFPSRLRICPPESNVRTFDSGGRIHIEYTLKMTRILSPIENRFILVTHLMLEKLYITRTDNYLAGVLQNISFNDYLPPFKHSSSIHKVTFHPNKFNIIFFPSL
jgi:hypothetical protein